jgi:molybdenum cofactor cytidylyltransferase
MGGFSKALVPVDDETAVARLGRESIAGGFGPVVVVLGAFPDIQPQLPDGSVLPTVVNDRWSAGRTGSLQVGLAQLPEEANVLVWPVDFPFVEAKTLQVLRTAVERDTVAQWWIPTFEGRGGHPIVLGPAVRRRVEHLGLDTPLRAIQADFGPQVARIPVNDPFVLANVDQWSDYSQYMDLYRRRSEDAWTDG